MKKRKFLLNNIIVIVIILIFFIPSIWIVFSSMRPKVEIFARPPIWIPQKLDLGSYKGLLGFESQESGIDFGQDVPFFEYAKNSIIISSATTVLTVVLGTFAGFAFSNFRFRIKNSIFLGFMMARALPGVALSLPLLIVYSRLGLSDSIIGLIIAYSAMNIPFIAWLMTGFFQEIPNELNDAAFIDGCSRWGAFLRVNLPLILPGAAASGIFAFLTSWNEF